jgi:hypothetical protein
MLSALPRKADTILVVAAFRFKPKAARALLAV